jgi:hypothetical protein
MNYKKGETLQETNTNELERISEMNHEYNNQYDKDEAINELEWIFDDIENLRLQLEIDVKFSNCNQLKQFLFELEIVKKDVIDILNDLI